MKNISHGIYFQRQIEARLLKSVIEGLTSVCNEEVIIRNIRETIERIAFEDGRKLKEENKNDSLSILADHWRKLSRGDSLVIEDFIHSNNKLTFRITRCKYAEYYKKLNVEKLGNTLSCCRDKAFLNGLSENIEICRSKTILEGNPSCDFVYSYKMGKERIKA
jgi:hypothetical protein